MKNKIILIEDRVDRMENLLGDDKNSISKIEEGLILKKGNEAEKIFENIRNKDINELKGYDLIMMHYSPLNAVGKDLIDTFCKEEGNKKLVYFSGGLSTITYLNNHYECLSLNSSQFYTKNLIEIFKDYSNIEDIPLLQLAYGPKWELNILLKYRTLLKDLIFQQKKILDNESSQNNSDKKNTQKIINRITNDLKPIHSAVMGDSNELFEYSFLSQIDRINKLIGEKLNSI